MLSKRIVFVSALLVVALLSALYLHGLSIQQDARKTVDNRGKVLSYQMISLYAPLHREEDIATSLCQHEYRACIEKYAPTEVVKETCLYAFDTAKQKSERIQAENPLILSITSFINPTQNIDSFLQNCQSEVKKYLETFQPPKQ